MTWSGGETLTTEAVNDTLGRKGFAMLVLSFGLNEKAVIGDRDVVVTIVSVRGNRVRLGFEADRSIPIHRECVFDDIKRRGGVREGRLAGTADK